MSQLIQAWTTVQPVIYISKIIPSKLFVGSKWRQNDYWTWELKFYTLPEKLLYPRNVTSSGMWPHNSPRTITISYRCSIVTQSLPLAVFDIVVPQTCEVHHLQLSTRPSSLPFVHLFNILLPVHVTSPVTWRFDSSCPIFPLLVHWNRASISNRFRDILLQTYLYHDLDILGHVTSSSTWPLDTHTPFPICASL